MDKQKTYWVIIVTILILVVLAMVIFLRQPSPISTTDTDQTNTENDQVSIEDETPTVVNYVPTTGTPGNPTGLTKGQDYNEVIQEFAGRRIQFENCLATPTQMVLKNGSRIMLDGLSPDPQTIKVGEQVITLHGYELAYMTISDSQAPTTIEVDCSWMDQTQFNTAQISLQP